MEEKNLVLRGCTCENPKLRSKLATEAQELGVKPCKNIKNEGTLVSLLSNCCCLRKGKHLLDSY